MSDTGKQPLDLRDAVAVLHFALATLITYLPEHIRDIVLAEIDVGLIASGMRPSAVDYGGEFVKEIRQGLEKEF